MNWKKFRTERIGMLEKAVEGGKVDGGIIPLLEKINESRGLVTTSSCQGRIVLLASDIHKRKKTAKFYKKWHRKVDPEEVELAISSYSEKLPLWFRMEPFILHVTARNVESASRFLEKARFAGVKRGGIQTIKKDRVNIEIRGSVTMVIPVEPIRGEWNGIIGLANRMFEINLKMIEKLEKIKWQLSR